MGALMEARYLMVAGGCALFWVSNCKSRRRHMAGLEELDSDGCALATEGLETVVRVLGILMIVASLVIGVVYFPDIVGFLLFA